MAKTTLADSMLDILGGAASKKTTVTEFIDTGFPPLNRIISGSYDGGMPVGRIVEMYGPTSCGKTAISTVVMRNAIAKGGVAMFMDHERSFEHHLAHNLGLDVESPNFIYARPETLEESFMKAIKITQKIRDEELIPPGAPIVAVFDSLAAMVPKSKMEKEMDELTMADSLALAKTLSGVMPALQVWASKLNMLVLLLNQTRENPGVTYGDNTRTPGGKAPGFYSSVRIALNASKLFEGEGKKKVYLGQRVRVDITKNKISAPFRKTEWDFLANEDGSGRFDVTGSLLDHLVEVGVLELSGSRIKWTDGKSFFKSQLVETITKNKLEPELLKMLPV